MSGASQSAELADTHLSVAARGLQDACDSCPIDASLISGHFRRKCMLFDMIGYQNILGSLQLRSQTSQLTRPGPGATWEGLGAVGDRATDPLHCHGEVCDRISIK